MLKIPGNRALFGLGLAALLLSGGFAGYVLTRDMAASANGSVARDLTVPPAVPEVVSPGLKGALADGRLTVGEFNAGVRLTADCLRAEGFQPEIIAGKGQRPDDVTFTVPDADGVPDRETVNTAQGQADHCFREHLCQYQVAWMEQGVADPVALRRALATLSACMRDAGAPLVASDMSFEQLNENIIVRGDGRSPANEQWYRHYVPCRIALEEEQGFRFP